MTIRTNTTAEINRELRDLVLTGTHGRALKVGRRLARRHSLPFAVRRQVEIGLARGCAYTVRQAARTIA